MEKIKTKINSIKEASLSVKWCDFIYSQSNGDLSKSGYKVYQPKLGKRHKRYFVIAWESDMPVDLKSKPLRKGQKHTTEFIVPFDDIFEFSFHEFYEYIKEIFDRIIKTSAILKRNA